MELKPTPIAVKSLSVSIRDVSLGAKIKKMRNGIETPPKPILHKIESLEIPAGKMVAIMGTTGSGKTTLLNCLASRLDASMSMEGQVLFRGEKWNFDAVKTNVGYVLQTDHLLPNLTVCETLYYAAMLRLPSSMTTEQKVDQLNNVLSFLRLRDCQHTWIGTNQIGGRRGISGGEKRRVSIGVQMLTNPSVLLLDEPTSGLDAFTAHHTMETLRSLAQEGRTVICSIHQPRSDVWNMFDIVILMSKGHVVYFGERTQLIPYFKSIDPVFACPPLENPADFYLDLITVDTRTPRAEEKSQARLELLVEEHKKKMKRATNTRNNNTTADIMDDVELNGGDAGAGYVMQTLILLERGWRNIVRDRLIVIARFVEVLLMSIITGWIFWKVDDSISGIESRKAFMYVVISLQPYLILAATVLQYSEELRIFDRELHDGMYSVVPYWIATKVSTIPIDFLTPILFPVIVYWMVGMRAGFIHFLWFTVVLLVIQYMSASFAFMTSCLVRDFAGASLICNSFTAFWSYSGGYLINQDTYPPYLTWIGNFSPWRWGVDSLYTNEFKDNEYNCPYPPGTPDCDLYDGNRVLDDLGVRFEDLSVNITIVFCMSVFYNLIGLVALKAIKVKPLVQ